MSAAKELSPKGSLILVSVFLFVGCSLLALLGWAIYIDLRPLFWEEVDCQIESTSVREFDSTYDGLYEVKVEYSYYYDGEPYYSNKVAPWYSGDSDYSKVQSLLSRYPAGAETKCLVNPDHPGDAVLMLDIQWYAFALLILPLVFVIPAVWQLYRLAKAGSLKRWAQSCGETVTFKKGGAVVGLIFFGLFLIPGILYFLLAFLFPAIKVISAQSWEATPCTIIHSRYVTHRASGDDPGVEYTLDILYGYRYGEKEYKSNDYDLHHATSSDSSFIRDILARYPAGEARTCYVNPGRPEESILNRDPQWSLLFWGFFFPLPFIAVGGWGYYRILCEPLKDRFRNLRKLLSGFR